MVTLPKPGDKVAGKYVVESLIGRGGMGAVFKAKNVLTGRRVALKWIATLGESAPELEARLLREAQVMGPSGGACGLIRGNAKNLPQA